MFVRFVSVFFHAFVVCDTLIDRVNTLTTPEERHVSVCVTDGCEVYVIDVFETMYYRRFESVCYRCFGNHALQMFYKCVL